MILLLLCTLVCSSPVLCLTRSLQSPLLALQQDTEEDSNAEETHTPSARSYKKPADQKDRMEYIDDEEEENDEYDTFPDDVIFKGSFSAKVRRLWRTVKQHSTTLVSATVIGILCYLRWHKLWIFKSKNNTPPPVVHTAVPIKQDISHTPHIPSVRTKHVSKKRQEQDAAFEELCRQHGLIDEPE